jgi:hypothetical protein
MLRAAWTAWIDSHSNDEEPDEARVAFHSDIRALRPEAWSSGAPLARGCDVEQAMWLAGVSSRDFADVVDIALTPDRVAPVEDIASLCARRAAACQERAAALTSELPPPNPYGRPPLPWHRNKAREARALHRAAMAWEALGRYLVSNRW